MLYFGIWGKIASAVKNALTNAWRFLNGQLDSLAYKLLSSVYNFFKELSNIYLYNETIMDVLGKRIGLILGIFILFKLAVTIVSYIINPDKLSDSSKGPKKIITSIAVSLVLLATVNYIFKEAYIIQSKIVSNQIIEKIFFGNKSNIKDIDISYYLYSAFLTVDLDACLNESLYDETKAISPECSDAIEDSDADEVIRKEVIQKRNLRPVLSKYDNINAECPGGDACHYIWDYTPIISLVCAVIAILILLSSCLDVATRIIKLLFLQIIAPIPIVSNMTPGKGEEVFKKWYKECLNTYLSLFIRIAVISFAVFMISLLRSTFADILSGKDTLIQVLLILGCLMFAKQMPKLIENIFGIKMDGMALNPMKKFQEEAAFGKQITGLARGTAAAGIGLGAGTIGAVGASHQLGNKWWEQVGAGFRGAARGLAGGMREGYNSKSAVGAVRAGLGRSATNAAYVESLDGSSFGGRLVAGTQQFFGWKTGYDKKKASLDDMTNFDSSIDAMLKRAEAESIKHNDLTIKDSSGNTLTMEQHKIEQEQLNRLRNENLSFDEFVKMNGDKLKNTEKMNFKDFAASFKAGNGRDATTSDYNSYLQQIDQNIAEAKTAHEQYILDHDKKVQQLNDKINKDTKIFATQYATDVSNGKYNDQETLGYVSRVTETHKKLEKHFSEKEMEQFDIFDDSGNFSGAKAKDAKQNAVSTKYMIENVEDNQTVYNAQTGKYEDAPDKTSTFNRYQRQKANAEATKPKGKK